MAVCQNEIGISIVVVIKEPQTPTAQQPCRWSNFSGSIDEGQILLILIQTKQFLIDIGYKQVLPAIAVVICCVHSHTGSRRTGVAVRNPGHQADLFKLSFPFVYKQEVSERVVCDEEIHQAIVVYVGRDRSEGFAKSRGDP